MASTRMSSTASRFVLVVALSALALPSTPASARGDTQTITVNTTVDELVDNGNCSLREAVTAANTNAQFDECPGFVGGLDVIIVPAGTYQLSVGTTGENAAEGGDLDITGETRIEGTGAGQTFIQAGNTGGSESNGIDRVFHITGATYLVTFQDLTIRNGKPGAGQPGGGLYRDAFGPVNLTRVVISNNLAGAEGGGLNVNGNVLATDSSINFNIATGSGGGMRVPSTMTLTGSSVIGNSAGGSGGGLSMNGITATNSTISGNSAVGNGGGIALPNSSLPAKLHNVTVANNRADSNGTNVGTGGGVYQPATDVNATEKKLQNSIIADNIVGSTSPAPSDCVGEWHSLGGNIIETTTGCVLTTTHPSDQFVDPQLLALDDYGGPTATHALQLSSPALDKGVGTDPASGCPATDQRGVGRPADSSDDDKVAECDSGAVEYPALTVKGPLDPIVEGDSGTSPAAFKVKLSSPAVVLTQFHYAIEGLNGAVAGSDFLGESGLDSIEVGSTTKIITVQIVGDTEQDANQEFVRLTVDEVSNNVSISKESAKATILDDDPIPHPRSVDLTLKRHLRAEGEVHVPDSASVCFAQVPVRVQRKTPDGWTKGVQALTNNNGLYEAQLEDKTGRYRAFIPKTVVPGPGGGHSCGKDTSAEKTHTH